MNVLETVGATIILISLMILVAKMWGWMKNNYPGIAFIGLRLFLAVLIMTFIIY